MRTALVVLALVLAALLPGCTTPDAAAGAPPATPPGQARARAVVAVLEFDGTNPYHDDFARPAQQQHPATFLAGYPADAVALPLGLDAPTYDAAVAADNDTWNGFTPNTLHYVPGTNIVGMIRFGEGRPLDQGGHNTGTTSLVAGANHGFAPDADLVVVTGDLFAGMQWIAAQPWIDAVSVSLGPFLGPCAVLAEWCGLPLDVCTGNPFLPVSFVHHTRSMWRRGGETFAAAGYGCGSRVTDVGTSYPGNTITSFFSGPSWTMTVGTYHPDREQGEWQGAFPVDYLSQASGYTAAAPKSLDGENPFGNASGAIPRSAGIYAAILLHARALLGDTSSTLRPTGILAQAPAGHTLPATGPLADGTLTQAEAEAAFLHGAIPVDAVASYQRHGADAQAWAQSVMPAPPAAEFLTMGYGLVNATALANALAILDGTAVPDRLKEDAWRLASDAVRDALWATIDDNGLYLL